MEITSSVYNPASPDLMELTLDQMTEIFGRSGTEVYSGYYRVDDVVNWNNPYQRAKIVDEMRKQDVAVSSALNLLYAPIMATNWSIQGGDDEQREFIEKQIFGMTQRTWQEFLLEALGYLPFGFYIFEQIYHTLPDGRIGLFDLAPRIPRSIEKFRTQDEQAGITQNLYGDITPRSGHGTQVSIPLEKLLIFTNHKEGDDLIGQSVLRGARRHYVIKDRLYLISGMSAERFGMGVPVVTYPLEGGEAEKDKASELGQNLKGNEKGYIAIKEGWKVEILTPSANSLGTMMENLIAHHNRQILMSCLAHSMDLGSNSTGSYALSSTQQTDLMNFAEQKATYIASQINKYVIKKLIDLNWGVQEEYPELVFEALGVEDDEKMANVYKSLYDMGIIDNDPELTNYIRKIFSLPEIPDEEIAVMIEEKQRQKEINAKRMEKEMMGDDEEGDQEEDQEEDEDEAEQDK